MLDKLFTDLRKMIRDVGGQLRAANKSVETKRRARDELRAAAISRADTISAFNALVDARAACHVKKLAEKVNQRACGGDPARFADMMQERSPFLTLAPKDGELESPYSKECALAWLMGDQLKQRFKETVNNMSVWPEHSMHHADKTAQLAVLDREIAGLEKDITELAETARRAGININSL